MQETVPAPMHPSLDDSLMTTLLSAAVYLFPAHSRLVCTTRLRIDYLENTTLLK